MFFRHVAISSTLFCTVCKALPENACVKDEVFYCSAHADKNAHRNPAVDEKVGGIRSFCVYRRCEWMGAHSRLNAHLKERHGTDIAGVTPVVGYTECPYRGCGVGNTFHIPVCDLRPVLCHDCGTVIPYEGYKEHVLRDHTEVVQLACEYLKDASTHMCLSQVKYSTTKTLCLVNKDGEQMRLQLERGPPKDDSTPAGWAETLYELQHCEAHYFSQYGINVSYIPPPKQVSQAVGIIETYSTTIDHWRVVDIERYFTDYPKLKELVVRDGDYSFIYAWASPTTDMKYVNVDSGYCVESLRARRNTGIYRTQPRVVFLTPNKVAIQFSEPPQWVNDTRGTTTRDPLRSLQSHVEWE